MREGKRVVKKKVEEGEEKRKKKKKEKSKKGKRRTGTHAFLVLDLGLHILDRIRWFHLERDGFARERLYKNLHNLRKGSREERQGSRQEGTN